MDDIEVDEGLEQDRPVIADLLTGQPREATELEDLVQRTIVVLAGEYGFPLEAMARDVPVAIEVDGRRQRKRADLVVFTPATRTIWPTPSGLSSSASQEPSRATEPAGLNS
jgi:hypothetical protein